VETAELLGRKPFLWDNLFANDGPRNCKFLKLRAPAGRASEAFAASAGWAWNPMNQAWLSRIVLRASRHALVESLPPAMALERAIRESCSPALAAFLSRNREIFLTQGLDGFPPGQAEAWLVEIADREFDEEPVAREIRRWLAGGYSVGAECLTD